MGLNSIRPTKNTRYEQGYYSPVNKEKIIGNPFSLIYRSSWELKFCKFLDNKESVIKWGMEIIKIDYISPIDNKIHHYYPDFYFEMVGENGIIRKMVGEVKAGAFLIKPIPSKAKNKESYLKKLRIYIVIQAKIKYATSYCNKKGYEYIILSDKYFK